MRPALLPAETEVSGLRDPLSQGAGPREGLGAAARTRPLRGDFLPAPGASTTTPEGGHGRLFLGPNRAADATPAAGPVGAEVAASLGTLPTRQV